MIYADTSFFVSLYLSDLSDDHAQEVLRRAAQHPRLWLTPLHRAEWAHAIAQHVFQRKISAREAQQVHKHFQRDRVEGLWLEVNLREMTFEVCVQLA